MTEETRSWSELQTANKELTLANETLVQSVEGLKAATRLRSRRYQTAGQVAIDNKFGRWMFNAGVIHRGTPGQMNSTLAFNNAIAAWKAQQEKDTTS